MAIVPSVPRLERTELPPAALTDRADLLAEEADLVSSQGITWNGRLQQLRGYGLAGGSAADRKSIVVYLAQVERERKR